MVETCEKWLGLVNSCIFYARQTCEIYLLDLWNLPDTALLSGFQSSQGYLKSTE